MTPDIDQLQRLDFVTLEKRVAILIGVSKYQSPWDDLPFVLRDIQAEHGGLELVLRDDLGDCCFPASGIFSLIGEISERNVQESLFQKLLNDPQINERTLVLLYLSGHVAVDTAIGNIPCFVCSSTEHDRIANTSITFRWLVEDILKKCPASIFLIIDACFSGSLLNFFWPGNVAVFLSSAHDKESFADSNGLRSRFTSLVMSGLQGAGGKDGIVTTHTLFSYISREARRDAIQEPQFHPPQTPFLLATYRPSITAVNDSPFDERKLRECVERFAHHCEADYLMESNKSFIYSQAFATHLTFDPGTTASVDHIDEIGKERQNVIALEQLVTWSARNDSSFALVLGDTGLGKSILLKRFAYELSKKVLSNDFHRFPLLLNLRMYLDSRLDNPATLPDRTQEQESQRRFRAILMDWLQNEIGIPILWTEFIRLVEDGRLLLLLDGLDEMCRDSRSGTIEACPKFLILDHSLPSSSLLLI